MAADEEKRAWAPDTDALDALDVFEEPDLDGARRFGAGGSPLDARQAGDDGVEGLDKITAQMTGGEHRPEQQEMCRAVAEALVTETHLVVQAGTGTGKSLAYLVPAALSAWKKVVVATATKALQDQLADKDLPLVESGLGLDVPLDVAVLKGRSNYICRQRVSEVGAGGVQAELGDQAGGRADEAVAAEGAPGDAADDPPPEGLVEEVRRLVAWSQTSGTGDRADLAFEPSDRAWNMLSVGPRECPGAFNCPQGGRCFAESARDRAAAADIVVVNTHLYGAHLASGGAVLPEHEVVVFDEAHELEEVMTASLGVEVTPGRFRSLVTAARPLVEPRDAALLESLATAGDRLGALLGERIGTRVLQDDERGPGRGSGDDRELAETVAQAAELSRRVTDALRRGGAQRSFLGEGEAADPDRASRKTRTLQAAAHLSDDLHRLESRHDGEVAWVDGTRRNVRLRLSPIDVGPALSSMLWGEVTSVLTSATIPPRIVERVGPRGLRDRGAQRRQPLRLPRPRAALRGPAPARPARPGRGGGAARGAGAVARGGGRAHARPLHQPPGHRGGGRGARTRAPLRVAAAGRPPQGAPARGIRPRRDLVPLRHARLLAGRRHPGPRALAGHDRPPSLPAARRPAAAGAPRPGGRDAPSRWWTCRARPRCWRRERGG